MPYIHLETSSDLTENGDIPQILEALVTELARHPSVEPKSIKACHSLRHTWAMGEGAAPGFARCTLAILPRTLEERKQISQQLSQVLQQAFRGSLAAGEVNLTLEVRQMEAETYFRG
jgi:5-carboxymethyl-2-hydroxymuconate isomerase